MDTRARVTSNRIDAISGAVRRAVQDDLVLDVAEDVADGASRMSRRRTGFLAGSWKAEKTGEGRAVAYSDANTVQLHEYGTVHMSAQPMATPAAEAEKAKLGRRAKTAVKRAAR